MTLFAPGTAALAGVGQAALAAPLGRLAPVGLGAVFLSRVNELWPGRRVRPPCYPCDHRRLPPCLTLPPAPRQGRPIREDPWRSRRSSDVSGVSCAASTGRWGV